MSNLQYQAQYNLQRSDIVNQHDRKLHQANHSSLGSLPNTIESRLTPASIEQLKVWGRIFDTESLGDVFREYWFVSAIPRSQIGAG
jgi:hypothetical protein